MIQEKDFLYRVPVKTALITTPRGQIRNPEILVDVEGGEFMHGNILDANSTNKLINQSVKDAVDDKLIESGSVTKDLLDTETSARTKGDEDLGAKIKAEQTRAEGKEKEISDKLAIVDGDSNTEGSFRKAIADVVAAAPEDLDTLKEIADKLAGNDDLHTALNQAITEKADASALANEVARATGAESGLQAAIATKADATALSNYIPYDPSIIGAYQIDRRLVIKGNDTNFVNINPSDISLTNGERSFTVNPTQLRHIAKLYKFEVNSDGINFSTLDDSDDSNGLKLSYNGVTLPFGNTDHVLTSDGTTINISQYAKKTELPTVPTRTSQLTNDSNFASTEDISILRVGLSRKQDKITANEVDVTDIETADITRLRTIVTELLTALSESNLIRQTSNVE